MKPSKESEISKNRNNKKKLCRYNKRNIEVKNINNSSEMTDNNNNNKSNKL